MEVWGYTFDIDLLNFKRFIVRVLLLLMVILSLEIYLMLWVFRLPRQEVDICEANLNKFHNV